MRWIIGGFIVFLAWASWARYHYVCEIKQLCSPQPENTRPLTLAVKDGDEVILEGYEQFLFQKGAVEPELSENNQLFLERLAYYLSKKQGKELNITANHLISEKSGKIEGSFQENIGLARAEAIRKRLVKEGLDEKRIFLDHILLDADSLPLEPISFFVETDKDGIPSEYTKPTYTFRNMTFSDANFEYNSDVFQPGEQFLAYADSVKHFLELNEDKTLYIIGHTDSIGSDAFNEDLGMRRARNAGLFFQKKLKVQSKVQVESRGRTEPVAPNDSPENRQKNRRVNIVIK
jgi:OOP family OmpA-OmpF porin